MTETPPSSKPWPATPGARAVIVPERVPTVLRRMRIAAGLSAADAAQLLNLDRSAISRIETGKRALTVSEIQTLAQAYGYAIRLEFTEPTQ